MTGAAPNTSFSSRGPSPATLRWVERSLAGGSRVVAWRRMTGGIASVVHRLTIDHGSHRETVVLRQYDRADIYTTELARNEVSTLRLVHQAGLPAPEPIAADADGQELDGHPTILMTRLPGRLELTPNDPDGWLRQIASMAVRIHHAKVAAPPSRHRIDALAQGTPASATCPAVWRAAFDILRQPAPQAPACFIHGDFQHFNLLWRRGRLTGVVDWTMSCAGPADLDTGHCRLNLAVLFGSEWAERFRLAYEAEAGRAVDPWWDVYALTAYDDQWRKFIPVQVAGRAPVDADGMTARVERLLETIVRRA